MLLEMHLQKGPGAINAQHHDPHIIEIIFLILDEDPPAFMDEDMDSS